MLSFTLLRRTPSKNRTRIYRVEADRSSPLNYGGLEALLRVELSYQLLQSCAWPIGYSATAGRQRIELCPWRLERHWSP